MHTIAMHSSEGDLWKMNRRSEETIVIINMLVRLLLWDLVDRFSEIGLQESPLTIKQVKETFGSEGEILVANKKLFIDSIEYFKDCMECFFVLCRQKDKRTFDEVTFAEILQLVERVRFNIGTTMESLRLCIKNFELNKTMKKKAEEWQARRDGVDKRAILKTISITNEDVSNMDSANNRINLNERLKELYKNKISRTKVSTPTRESKINLKARTQEGLLNFNPQVKPKEKKSSKGIVMVEDRTKIKEAKARTMRNNIQE